MNAETRAKELMAAIVERGTGGWRFAAEVEEALPLIATALRQAENDKLEEAAQRLERIDNSGLIIVQMAPTAAATLIRSLKSGGPLDIVKVGTEAFERGLNSKSKD